MENLHKIIDVSHQFFNIFNWENGTFPVKLMEK